MPAFKSNCTQEQLPLRQRTVQYYETKQKATSKILNELGCFLGLNGKGTKTKAKNANLLTERTVCHLDVNTSLALHHINTLPLQIKRRNHKILCFQKDIPSTFNQLYHNNYGKKFEHHSLKTRGAELGSLVMLASLFLLSSLKEGRDA